MPHDAALQDRPGARVRREPVWSRPGLARRRRRPAPDDIGFGRRFIAAISFGSVLNPVNSSIIAVALVPIGRAFGAGASVTTWLVSALYLATAIGQPTMGRLADLAGPRRVYLAGTATVAAGGLVGYLGWSLGSLIAARIVIGLGTSAAYPAAMAMVRHQAQRLNREAPGGVLGALAVAGQRNRALSTTYLRFGITMLITYGFIYGWTLWLEQGAGLSAAEAGFLMMPSFVVAAVVSALASRRSRLWPLLVAGAAVLAAGSAGLLLLTGRSPLWLLLVISVVFGAQNGLNEVTNQAAMYHQAPAGSTGTAAGMLRTFMYLGAIAAASLISLSFGHTATDAGLHRLAIILTIAAAALLAVTLADRKPAARPHLR